MLPLLSILIWKQQQLAALFLFDPEMFVVSYCQIYSFCPALNLDKIVIFWSFQQTAEEIYNLSHFKQEHTLF